MAMSANSCSHNSEHLPIQFLFMQFLPYTVKSVAISSKHRNTVI